MRSRTTLLTTVAAASLLLAGCASTPPGSSESSPAAGGSLAIAASVPLSGPGAAAGAGVLCGIESYLDSVNDAGGVGGYTFDVRSEDNKFDPAVSATIARDLAGSDTFAVFVGGSGPVDASRPVFQGARIPTFAAADGNAFVPPSWEGDYGYNPEYSREAASAAEFIADELDEDTASLAYVATATGEPSSKYFAPAFEEAGGTVALSEPIPPATTDFSASAQKLKDAGAPVVYAVMLDTQLAGLQKAAHAIGYEPIWVTWTIGYGPTYLDLVGDLAVGVYTSQLAWPETETDAPGVKEYVTAVEANCPDGLGDNGVKTGYALAAMMTHGVEQLVDEGAEVTRENFVKSFSIDDELMGTTPHVTITDDDHAGVSYASYWQVTSPKGDLKKVTDFAELPATPATSE